MSIDIHGKKYVTVAERLRDFRNDYPNYSLISDLIEFDANYCVVKATIMNEEGRVIATGLDFEDRANSNINKVSFVQNAETSAWGRALANFGYGTEEAVTSAEELVNSVVNQNPEVFSDKASDKQIAYLKTLLKRAGYGEDEYLASYGVTSFEELPKKDISLDINKLKVKV